MKKAWVFTLFLYLTILIFGSCASVPKEVQNDIMARKSAEHNIITDDFNFSYIKIADIKKNAEMALQKKYNQFKIIDNIDINNPSEINILTLKYLENYECNYHQALQLFFSQKEIDSQDINYSADSTGMYTYSFWNERDKLYGCVGDNGFIAMLKPDVFDISFACNKRNVKIYHVDRSDDLSDIYMLKNGEYSVGEAVNYINNWLNTEYKTMFPDYDYKVKTIIVREYENHYLFDITAELFFNDVPLDSFTMESAYDEVNKRMYMLYTRSNIKIQMVNINEIDSFTNGTGIISPIEAESIDECISLESALLLCENTFTDFKDITISDIKIKYTLTPVYDYIGEKHEGKNGTINIITQSTYASGTMLKSRPVWEFVIDVDPSEFLKDDEINTYGDVRKYIYVDMLSGELFYQLDIVLQGTGGVS